jgi:hypothetical protein
MPELASADTISPKVDGVALEPASEWTVDVGPGGGRAATVHRNMPYAEEGRRSGSAECSPIGQDRRSGGLEWTAELVTFAARGIEAQLDRALDQIDRLPSGGFYAGLCLVVVAVLFSTLLVL